MAGKNTRPQGSKRKREAAKVHSAVLTYAQRETEASRTALWTLPNEVKAVSRYAQAGK